MRNGLSKLQKGLLLLALENSRTVDRERERAFCERLQIKEIGELPHLTTFEALQGRAHASARGSISQAFSRLEKRGLVRKNYQYQVGGPLLWSGINLTAKGLEAAGKLEDSVLDVSSCGSVLTVARHKWKRTVTS